MVGESFHYPSCQALPHKSDQSSHDCMYETPAETKWVTNYLDICAISCPKDSENHITPSI